MWATEHTVETLVEPGAIWRAWVAVERWPEWNADIESISLSGPFARGATIAMTLRGQETVHLTITEAVEDELFVDEAEVGGTSVRTTHRIDGLDDGRFRIVYRLEAQGPAAEEIGPAVSADFPETIEALVEHASK